MSEKTLQIFSPLLPTVYVTAFLGRTDAPKVRCDLTDTHTHTHTHTADRHDDYRNPCCACAPRVNYGMVLPRKDINWRAKRANLVILCARFFSIYIQVNEKSCRLKMATYRDGVKRKGDKIGMGV